LSANAVKGLPGDANNDLAKRSIGPSLLSFDMVVLGCLFAPIQRPYDDGADECWLYAERRR
jgi:hypothetical protein